MLKIYGPAGARTSRALWVADEVGVEYERIEVAAEDREAFKDMNPNNRFPTIDDDGVVVFESMAINLYLAKKYSLGSLYPSDPAAEGRAVQWSFWGLTDLEPHLITCLIERIFKPEAARNPEAAAAAAKNLDKPLSVLEGILTKTAWLAGDSFSIADLNVASVLSFAGKAGVDLAGFPKTYAWLKACQARPTAKAMVAAWPLA